MISRRGFIQTGAAATFVSGPFFSGKTYAAGNADIAKIQGTDVRAAVEAAVAEIGGIGKFVNSGDRVMIKPNLSFASPPERATTTHPATIKAVMDMCIEAGASKVLVVDNPLQDASIINTNSEVAGVVNDTDKALLLLLTSENLFKEVSIPQGKSLTSTEIAKVWDEVDVHINLPVAKHHSATFVSLGVKGNLGVIWDRIHVHNTDLNQGIADLATIATPELTIVDAMRALTTRGPQGPGRVKELNTIIASTDPVAADALTVEQTEWSGYQVEGARVQHLKNAADHGVGTLDPHSLNLVSKTV
jgi:uncharacterized protein (DUF362 family)